MRCRVVGGGVRRSPLDNFDRAFAVNVVKHCAKCYNQSNEDARECLDALLLDRNAWVLVKVADDTLLSCSLSAFFFACLLATHTTLFPHLAHRQHHREGATWLLCGYQALPTPANTTPSTSPM